MKLVETLELANSDKVFVGPKQLKLEFDTETGRITLDTPAMFTDPVVRLDDLAKILAQFEAIRRDSPTYEDLEKAREDLPKDED
jgi:hypothetical protein